MGKSTSVHTLRSHRRFITVRTLLPILIFIFLCGAVSTIFLSSPDQWTVARTREATTWLPSGELTTTKPGEPRQSMTPTSPITTSAPAIDTTAEPTSIPAEQTSTFDGPATPTSAASASATGAEESGTLLADPTTETTKQNPAMKELDRWAKMQLPADWMECIRQNLQLDKRGRPMRAVTAMTDAIPLLITPLTGDVKFFPYFVCSMDVAVRYHYVIQNEREPDTTAVIDELQRRFGNSGRFLVLRNRYNRGYSGSMNQGFEWALKERTAEEVPWVFACGVDVIFEPGLLANMVKVVQENTRDDAAMLAALRAEVELEERLVREGNYSYYERWAPRGRPLKVLRSGYPGVPLNVRTAPLLPDRIRYMVADENRESGIVTPAELRKRFFGNYVATVTPVEYALGTIAVTRLALSTVGYFDENYFPAYMDDIDLRWRHFAYGFGTLHGEHNGPVTRWHHYNAANLRGSPFVDPDLQKYGTEDNYSRRAFVSYIRRSKGIYDKLKYGPRDVDGVWREAVQEAEYKYMHFNVSHFPADTWVLDEDARRCMFHHTYNYEMQAWSRPSDCSYNPRTLEESGILGVDQLANFRSMIEGKTFDYQ
ncbi:putative GIPL galf transferase [Leishmania infantum JPCM5]|uniref:GIPL_galf_transferase_-_putative n=2 Tax=Leishmania infantum TaxID=5671 RepID=A0A6L0XPL9_LEIIN|nr:putative GIPL galf transferase [Leishmania infantum JPCM5]CAC9528853.1 GIPL_galf_transferase_-_putative [Leishmania infantum]CBZ08923.1 putative GIPL galf transferase [Leishmania infantum JPCM5]SUZ44987.1 GIPL_galf_transferase_-_putative [Leishmania infantum]|eukprot:XP_003392726.1 putative GIPL galf transferase [Leishmania infantum JPCM5]